MMEAFRRRLLDYNYLVPAIMANTAGYAISLYLLPRHPIFGVPDFTPPPWVLLLAIAVGIFTAAVCVLFMKSYKKLYSLFLNIKAPLWVKPVIGGAITGFLGFIIIFFLDVPPDSVMSDCIYPLHYVIDYRISFVALMGILGGRIATTLFTVTSRNSGGIVMPTMFIGALAGSALASVCAMAPTPLAIAGIAAALSAVFNAPLGAILIVTEMSSLNYAAPAAVAAFVAYVMARKENILHYHGYVSSKDWV
jgi:CIC family chloride channel protein